MEEFIIKKAVALGALYDGLGGIQLNTGSYVANLEWTLAPTINQ